MYWVLCKKIKLYIWIFFRKLEIWFIAGFGDRNPGDPASRREWLLLVLGGSEPRDGSAGGGHDQGFSDGQICENTEGTCPSNILVSAR